MTFQDVVMFCFDQPEFVREWSRLRGVSFARAPVDVLVDEATGYDKKVLQLFIDDVKDLVWDRLEPTP